MEKKLDSEIMKMKQGIEELKNSKVTTSTITTKSESKIEVIENRLGYLEAKIKQMAEDKKMKKKLQPSRNNRKRLQQERQRRQWEG